MLKSEDRVFTLCRKSQVFIKWLSCHGGVLHHKGRWHSSTNNLQFTSRVRVCPKCLSVSVGKLWTQLKGNNTPVACEPITQDPTDLTIDPDIIPNSATEQYSPNCSNLLYQLLLYQSKCLENTKLGKDHRCNRWSKDLISFAVSVYILTPEHTVSLRVFYHFPVKAW